MNHSTTRFYIKICLSIVCLCGTIILNISQGEPSIRNIIYPENIKTQQNKDIGEIANNMIKTQLQIHKQLEKNIISKQDNPLEILENIERLINEDILEKLDQNENKAEIVNTYLSETASILPQGNNSIFELETSIQEYERQKSFCNDQKELIERDFYGSLDNFNQIRRENSLAGLIEKNECIAEFTTKTNAHKIIKDKIQRAHTLLEKKYTYLNDKRDLIIKHFEIIKNDLAKDLIEIKNRLQQYNTSTKNQ